MRGPDGAWERDRTAPGERITDKTAAEKERDRLRTAIREGSLHQADVDRPQRETLTLAQLLDTCRRRYLDVRCVDTVVSGCRIRVICRTELERADGTRRAFGEWLIGDDARPVPAPPGGGRARWRQP